MLVASFWLLLFIVCCRCSLLFLLFADVVVVPYHSSLSLFVVCMGCSRTQLIFLQENIIAVAATNNLFLFQVTFRPRCYFKKNQNFTELIFFRRTISDRELLPPAFIQRRDSGLALRNSVFCQSVATHFCHTASKVWPILATLPIPHNSEKCVTQSVASHPPCASCVQC